MIWKGFTPAERLMPYLAYLHDDLKPYAVFAGGAVLDIDSADDVDIFLLNAPPELLLSEYSLLGEAGIAWNLKEEPYGKAGMTSVKFTPADKEVNIVRCEHLTVEDLLNSFDLSCCMWAITRDRIIVRGDKATLPTEPIVVYPPSDPKQQSYTSHRLYKYIQRFWAEEKSDATAV